MTTILGTGLLGSGFARALAARGDAVRAWNRTFARAELLRPHGVLVTGDLLEAVRGVDLVHVVLSDDAAVDSVLESAAAGLAPGTLIVDHSTTSPGGASERTERWRGRGVGYLHAPVFMGPQNAIDATGLMLVSGPRDLVARAAPCLEPMTGQLLDLGPEVGRAAKFKLLGNLLLMAFASGFLDVIALARAMGISAAEVGTLFEHFNPGAHLPARYRRLIDGRYDQPSWDLAMARKDAGLMQAEAERAGVPLRMLPALVETMEAMLARGFGELDWTVIGKDLLAPE